MSHCDACAYDASELNVDGIVHRGQLIVAHERAADLVRSKAFRGLVDFEEHLHDPTADWRNSLVLA